MGRRKGESSGVGEQAPPPEIWGSTFMFDESVYSLLKKGPSVQWAR